MPLNHTQPYNMSPTAPFMHVDATANISSTTARMPSSWANTAKVQFFEEYDYFPDQIAHPHVRPIMIDRAHTLRLSSKHPAIKNRSDVRFLAPARHHIHASSPVKNPDFGTKMGETRERPSKVHRAITGIPYSRRARCALFNKGTAMSYRLLLQKMSLRPSFRFLGCRH
jgi:hypothetical protein